MNRLVLGVAWLAALPLAAQAPVADGARPITLQEAVTLAQRNAPAAVQASGQIRRSLAARGAAAAAFIPSVSLTSSASRTKGSRLSERNEVFRIAGPPWNYGIGINANLELFDGGRRFQELRQARATVNVAESNEILQQFGVALSVKQQYFAVLAAHESQAAARAQLEQAQQQFRVAAARVAAGAATRSDSLRSVIQVGNAQLALLTAQNSLRVANAALTRLVATPFTVTASPSDTFESRGLAVDSAELARLAAQSPLVRQAEMQGVVARAGVRAARASYMPTISLNYGRSGSSTDSSFRLVDDVYGYSSSFRIVASYPLFNQLQREQARVGADVDLVNAEAALRDARLRARQELAQYLGLLQTAEQRVAIQQASVDAADEDLRVQQQRYSLGASTLLDVLTSQTQLNQARAALIQARYDYRIAKAQLEALIGRDL